MLSRCLLGKRVLAENVLRLADLRDRLTELYISLALWQLGYRSTVRLIEGSRPPPGRNPYKHDRFHGKECSQSTSLLLYGGSAGFTCGETHTEARHELSRALNEGAKL